MIQPPAPTTVDRTGANALALRLYAASVHGPAPAILVLPGGGYVGQDEHEAEPVAEWLVSLGLHAFVLRYRVAPHRHPAPLKDAERALEWIRAGKHGLSVDPERVAVLGFSAGGHLAATLAGTAHPPALSVLCYPVISFLDDPHAGSVESLLGPNPATELLESLSADRAVTERTPPAFLWHTADDGAVPVSHSLRYAQALVRHGVPVELHVFPHGQHGLGLARDHLHVAIWTSLCERWLQEQGWVRAATGHA